MNELVLSNEFQKVFPSMAEGIKHAFDLFNQVQNFEDLERIFLQGNGLSPHTYRSYLGSVKQFYEFTNQMHPFQVQPADIERFYDHLVKNGDRNTAVCRISGLKKFFKGIEQQVPFYTSPFKIMTEKLTKKMNKVKPGKTKSSLNWTEYNALLDYLEKDTSLIGIQNMAMCYTLLATGLRAAELCNLKWSDVEWDAEYKTYFLNGIGKGSKPFRQMVLDPRAIEWANKAYIAQKGPVEKQQDDYVFYNNGNTPAPMTTMVLYLRIKGIGEAARGSGIIPRQSLTWSPHLFRRTACTLFYRTTGKDLVATQDFSRHASINTLAKHYVTSQADPEQVQSFANHRKRSA